MRIDMKQAREFLEKINEKDKVMIFTHKDLDGFASGSLLYNFCKKKGAKVEVRIVDYGISRISDADLTDFNKIVLSDLAPSSVSEDLAKLENKEILYTDHHQEDKNSPIPEFVLELRTTEFGYIPSSRTCLELTEKENKEIEWIGVLGVLSDMGQLHKINDDFLNKFYKENNANYKELNEFTKKLNSVIIYFSANIESFYKIAELKKIEDISSLENFYLPVENEFERLEQELKRNKEEFNKIVYFHVKSKYSMIKSPFITGVSGKEPNKIFIFTTEKIGNTIGISGRNQARVYNVSKIMQVCLDGLKDGWAGGHMAAAGGQVDKTELDKFKENLRNINLEEYRI